MKKDKEEAITKCFTFSVAMIVHIIADSEEEAKTKLDKEGGMVTKREVETLDTVELHNKLEKK
jgi:hypothetical protein